MKKMTAYLKKWKTHVNNMKCRLSVQAYLPQRLALNPGHLKDVTVYISISISLISLYSSLLYTYYKVLQQ